MDDRKFTLVTDKLDSKYEKPSGIKFPKALYEDEYFRGISAEAKVVYCVMLDLTQEARLYIRWSRLCIVYIAKKIRQSE